MSFEPLKRSRGNFDKLTKELEVLNKSTTSQNSKQRRKILNDQNLISQVTVML